MSKTVVGLFNSIEEANTVKAALGQQGYSKVTVVADDDAEPEYLQGSGPAADTDEKVGVGAKISHFFKSLTGGDDDVHGHYASGVNSGGGLLAATVEDEDASDVAALLKQHGARDIDNNYSDAAETGTPVYGGEARGMAGTVAEGTSIPVVEEDLQVGKRTVDRGGVRVYSHVVEEPVSADVTLRDENIVVERRPVNRVATAEDFRSGSLGTIEMKAMGEEAVVGKTQRVVEEVTVGKVASERTEQINDTVRHTEVEVERLDGTASSDAGYAATGSTTSKDRF